MKKYTQECKVGVWDVCFVARVYKDKITCSIRTVDYKGNTGTLSGAKRLTVTDQTLVKDWSDWLESGVCTVDVFVDEMRERLEYTKDSVLVEPGITLR
jgi:hypothetical protein